MRFASAVLALRLAVLIQVTMALRRGLQLLAPRLGDQGARHFAAPLCSSAANLPVHSYDDRSPVSSSCIPSFSRGMCTLSTILHLDVQLIVTWMHLQASPATLRWHQLPLDCLPLSMS